MARPPAKPFPWYNSLLFRVVALCVILMMFLLCSLFVIVRFYFHQLRTEINERTLDIVAEVEQRIRQDEKMKLLLHQEKSGTIDGGPGDSEKGHEQAETLAYIQNLLQEYESKYGVSLQLERVESEQEPSIIPHLGESPQIETRRTFTSDDQTYQLIAMFEINAQTELIMAYRNKYLMVLLLGFVATLLLMVYLILKALRPLSELADSIARIGEGALQPIEVKKNYGEILALEQTFNRMVTSLQDKDRMEQNLRQAQRLSALGNLAAGVAHDLRNPLNSIKLLSSHAMDTLSASGEDVPGARQLRTIRHEVDRLEDIVSGFLSLAKERELQLAPAQVDTVLDECVKLVSKDAESRGIRLIAELRAGATTLLLDEKHFKRAIINVLINAMEACSPGGRVRVFSRLTDVECEIEIRDDGAGMTREALDRAFEPYYTTKTTGTGLGLAITRGIIEEHGGKIELSSSSGAGTQVLIRLPLEQR